jgi:hypothetical protein
MVYTSKREGIGPTAEIVQKLHIASQFEPHMEHFKSPYANQKGDVAWERTAL